MVSVNFFDLSEDIFGEGGIFFVESVLLDEKNWAMKNFGLKK